MNCTLNASRPRRGSRLLSAALIVFMTTGCATGGIYRNTSTPHRMDVVATDQAAVEAAKSAQSHVGMSNQTQGATSGDSRGSSYSPPSAYEQLQTNTSQALVNGASSALNNAIYSLINKVTYR